MITSLSRSQVRLTSHNLRIATLIVLLGMSIGVPKPIYAQAQPARVPRPATPPPSGAASTPSERARYPRGDTASTPELNDPSAIFHAVSERDSTTTRYLLSAGVSSNAKNSAGQTPLIVAAMTGDVAVMHVLLDYGADINAKTDGEMDDPAITHEGEGYTPLMMAAWVANVDAVELLLAKGADVNAKGKDGRTALILSAFQGNVKIVKALLSRKIDVDEQDNDGSTALLGAAFNGHFEMVKALLDKRPDVNAKDDSNGTALMAAAANGHFDIVKALVAGGADIKAVNKEKMSALKFAEINNHLEIANFLSQAVAK